MEDIFRGVASANNKDHQSQDSLNGQFGDDEGFTFSAEWMSNRKFIKQLQKDNIDVSLFKRELGCISQRRRRKTCRVQTLHFLRSNVLQIILCTLVLMDAAIVIAEIILEIHSLKSSKEAFEGQLGEAITFLNETFSDKFSTIKQTNDAITDMSNILEKLEGMTCYDAETANLTSVVEALTNNSLSDQLENRPVPNQARSMFVYMKSPSISDSSRSHKDDVGTMRHLLSSSGPFRDSGASASTYSKKKKAHVLHLVSEILHFTSICILGLFVIEVTLKMVCTGIHFFKEKFEVLDACIICTSFVADIVFVYAASNEISVMVIFLMWRIVRVINGLMMHEKQRDEFRIQLQKKARRVSEMKLECLTTEKEMQDKYILNLEELCREMGSTEDALKRCKPRYKRYSKDQTNNALKSIAALTTGFMGGLVGAAPANKSAVSLSKYSGNVSPGENSGNNASSSSNNGPNGPGSGVSAPSFGYPRGLKRKDLTNICESTPNGSFEYTDIEGDTDSSAATLAPTAPLSQPRSFDDIDDDILYCDDSQSPETPHHNLLLTDSPLSPPDCNHNAHPRSHLQYNRAMLSNLSASANASTTTRKDKSQPLDSPQNRSIYSTPILTRDIGQTNNYFTMDSLSSLEKPQSDSDCNIALTSQHPTESSCKATVTSVQNSLSSTHV